MSLQWAPYTADGPHVRKVSIAGDILARMGRSRTGPTSRSDLTDRQRYDSVALNRTLAAVEAIEKAQHKRSR